LAPDKGQRLDERIDKEAKSAGVRAIMSPCAAANAELIVCANWFPMMCESGRSKFFGRMTGMDAEDGPMDWRGVPLLSMGLNGVS